MKILYSQNNWKIYRNFKLKIIRLILNIKEWIVLILVQFNKVYSHQKDINKLMFLEEIKWLV